MILGLEWVIATDIFKMTYPKARVQFDYYNAMWQVEKTACSENPFHFGGKPASQGQK